MGEREGRKERRKRREGKKREKGDGKEKKREDKGIRRHRREEGHLGSVVFAPPDAAGNLQAAKADGCPGYLQPLPRRVADTRDGQNALVPDDLCEEHGLRL